MGTHSFIFPDPYFFLLPPSLAHLPAIKLLLVVAFELKDFFFTIDRERDTQRETERAQGFLFFFFFVLFFRSGHLCNFSQRLPTKRGLLEFGFS